MEYIPTGVGVTVNPAPKKKGFSLANALKGIGGEYELNRVVGAFGGVAYIVGANAFTAWQMAEGRGFDLVAYCTAFPAGLGVVVGAIAGAVAWKDKGVASAKVIEQTGAVPAPPPAGPKVPATDLVEGGPPAGESQG